MSSSNTGKNSNGTNGSITLKSFSELANVLDLESPPPGPPDPDDETTSAIDPATTQTTREGIDFCQPGLGTTASPMWSTDDLQGDCQPSSARSCVVSGSREQR